MVVVFVVVCRVVYGLVGRCLSAKLLTKTPTLGIIIACVQVIQRGVVRKGKENKEWMAAVAAVGGWRLARGDKAIRWVY
jgi:hypothetical protein